MSFLPKITLINGFTGCGKDTLCIEIIKSNKNSQRLAISDVVKKITAQKYNFPESWNHDCIEKDLIRLEFPFNHRSVRDLVRDMWNQIRATDPDLIINNIIHTIKENKDIHYIITDFRDPSDYQKLKNAFGITKLLTIRLSRLNHTIPSREKMPEEYWLEHFVFDLELMNDTTPVQLYNKFKSCLINIK